MPIVSIQRSFAYLTSTNSCSKYGHHHPRIGITQVATKVSSEHSRPHVRLAARVKNDGLCVEEFSLSRRWTAILASIGIGSVAGLRRSVDAADGTRKSALKQQVEKSPLDRRTYKALSLSNGLRVLIVSDPEADSAAAAMDVHVGYFNDPDDLPGLAHFCEHMLFLGTKAFPDENSFNKFLTENGGGSNAFTDNEDTCFFFNCGVDALEGALERFASFFTGPLFTESATAREVNAINSEHLKNLQNDGFRINQVQSSRSNPAHPFHHFGTGSAQTLTGTSASDGTKLRGQLLAHYNRWYHAPLMTLCVLGREEPDILARKVHQFFGGIQNFPSGKFVDPAAAWEAIPPFVSGSFKERINVVPVTDARALEVTFPIVFSGDDMTITLEQWRRFTPFTHIGNVLGHEGPQSLCSLLRRYGWVTALNAGVSEENASFALMGISVELTEEGLSHSDEVLQLLFGYLRLVRETKTWPAALLQENIQLNEASWRSSEPMPPGDAVVRLAGNMHRYMEPFDYITGGARLRGGPELGSVVTKVASVLNPEHALVTAVSQSFGEGTMEIEPWYGTRFRRQSVAQQRGQWAAAIPSAGLDFPPPNKFLPRSLELKAPRTLGLSRGLATPEPEIRRQGKSWKVFFRQDTEFGVPKAYVFLELLTRYPRKSARNAVLARLYEVMLIQSLTEPLLYEAQLAGLVFDISSSVRGVQLFFGGYDNRLVDFAQSSMMALTSYMPGFDAARFDAQLDVLKRELASFSSQQSYQQAGYWGSLATTISEYPVGELLSEVNKVKVADVADYASQLWKEKLYGLALCQGNLLGKEADQLVNAVDGALRVVPLAEEEWPVPHIAMIPIMPQGPGCVLVNNAMKPAEKNSATEVIFQMGFARGNKNSAGWKQQAETEVLAALLSDAFYEELRTKQQLGYIVTCLTDKREGVLRLVFLVQGTALDPLSVMGKVDGFLETERANLRKRSDDEIQKVAASLAESRMTRPQQLGEAVERTWREITSRQFQWDRNLVEAALLKKVVPSDLIRLMDTFVCEGGAQRRRLVSLVYGSTHRDLTEKAQETLDSLGAKVIRDPRAFAKSQPVWTSTNAVPV